ncbi:TetR/AcrR family transcriptional regulator [Streptomyces tanashiensis]|uniref:TetR/AcrR family transcriptional regulator n=1 Tax=Streptomyces tanashiensis TaxID=67367 RepID=A0ABY6QQC6_9ACTN|nr:TetR/AcrR family transcriptional regulator [Streptomyces tanashiensis]UZX19895.1 TetR/AcrR family transcriptional regulator [Streptomyces tanashiensis]GGY42472.1 putative transcriptional regulator, TetR family protein [Streptomyces tanashiensis]
MTRRSADERREQLVEAAIRVMIRDGVARTTTRAVVSEAGLPLGAFHYCFRSKEELLHSVIERITLRSLAPATAPPAGEVSTRELIFRTLHAYWDQVRERPAEHMVTYELTQYALRQPGLAEVARRQYQHYLKVYSDHLEAIARLAGFRWTVPLPALARYGLSVMDGLTLNWLIDRDDVQAQAALDEYAEHLSTVAAPAPPEPHDAHDGAATRS